MTGYYVITVNNINYVITVHNGTVRFAPTRYRYLVGKNLEDLRKLDIEIKDFNKGLIK